MANAIKNQNPVYRAFEGDITFYMAKSYSRQPLKNKFEIESILEDYNLRISLFKKNEDLENGIIVFPAIPKIEFFGELLEFDYSELSESESTVIFKGDLKVLCNKKQKTFLGSIKKIDDTVFIKANLTLDTSEFDFEKVLNCPKTLSSAKTVSVEVSLQLKA
ncbi:hypothetical protein WJN01_06570 [Flavobacteriaceae bacterium SZ-1-7]|uniref:hypothetical protein n=1 Tax=Tamlana sedimenti TaxID=3134126 RepID=UPI003127F1F0